MRSLTLRLTVFVSLAVVFGAGVAWPFLVLLRGVIFPTGSWNIDMIAQPLAQGAVVDALRRGPDGSAFIETTPELRDYLERYPWFRYAVLDNVSAAPIAGSDPELLAAIMPNERRRAFLPYSARLAGDPNPHPTFSAETVDTPIGVAAVALYGYAFQWRDLLRYVRVQILNLGLPGTIPALLLTVSASWLLVRRGLAPLDDAARRLAQIDLDALDRRLPLKGVPEEVAPFMNAVNETLARLEKGVARQKRFLANAAHEIRTPIAVLRTRLDNPREEDLRRDLRRLRAISEQLLSSARISAQVGSANAMGKELDLAEIVEERAADYVPLAVENGRRIEFEGPSRPIVIRGERHALDSIVANLVDNALRAEPQGGVVILRLSEDATLEVIDHGEGVASEHREQVFEPFWRKSELTPGAGLGLAITRELVEKLGGRIWVEETPGGGATFKATFRAAVEG